MNGEPSAASGGMSAGNGGARSAAANASAAGLSGAVAGNAGASVAGGQAGMSASAGEGGRASPSATGLCPAGPFPTPLPANASATRIAGLPPLDTFNDNGNTRTNIEGPVWIDGKLYVSEFPFEPAPTSRILALDLATGNVTVAAMNVGTNGLAVDMSGALIATDHKQGAIIRMPFPFDMTEVLASGFNGKRFNSPNDVAVRSDGTIYFSDPDYQAPSMHSQDKTRAYSLPAGSNAASAPVVIDETRSEPNGVTLSADERTLYISGSDGIFSYPVQADGTITPGNGTRLNQYNGSADGLGMDCAGNLYIAAPQRVAILSPAGTEIGAIAMNQAESLTNVAFGGPERKTLFITSMGTGEKRGVFRVDLNVPGLPY
jgi:gluconolactonase